MERRKNSARTAPLFQYGPTAAQSDPLPSSSPAFATPVHPIRRPNDPASKPSILPILLPPAILRPLAFRTFTKKHDLTLSSSALQVFATFVGKHCGTGWREEGLAEKVLDEVAKAWKKSGGAAIVPGEGEELKNILRTIETSMAGGRLVQQGGLGRQISFAVEAEDLNRASILHEQQPDRIGREDSQQSLGVAALDIQDDEKDSHSKKPRKWLRIVGAFDQPRLVYNAEQKHFEAARKGPSLLPDPAQKTQLFRHRYNLIHQRLLRNESFQTSALVTSRTSSLQRSTSTVTSVRQAYKLTPIANLLGRSGSSHLLLGLLTISPTGHLTINDITGSVTLDVQHARPVPEDGAWFTPGMIVLADGMYEEEETATGPGLNGDGGIGGSIGGKFIGFSVGGPPCERRELTLGIDSSSTVGTSTTGGGFGWVDFLGVGSERAAGPNMRKLEHNVLKRTLKRSEEGRSRIVILGEVHLESEKTLQALKKVLGTYAAQSTNETPITVVVMGNFVRHAVMSGGGSGGSIEYKEYFDSLASALSDYPSILQTATFVFVPGDNDPWASSFSAGAATLLPQGPVPELFTTRIRRAFAIANVEAENSTGKKTDGEAIWSTNPTRLTLFGPAQEIVLFRDDLCGRLRRNAVRFRPLEQASSETDLTKQQSDTAPNASNSPDEGETMDVDQAVETAESHVPAAKKEESSDGSGAADLQTARKLVKTILDQGYLSPFPISTRPVLWDYAGALQLYPLPTALVLMDPEAPPFAVTYEGCHVMNPGPLVSSENRGIVRWMEYDAKIRRGKIKEVRF